MQKIASELFSILLLAFLSHSHCQPISFHRILGWLAGQLASCFNINNCCPYHHQASSFTISLFIRDSLRMIYFSSSSLVDQMVGGSGYYQLILATAKKKKNKKIEAEKCIRIIQLKQVLLLNTNWLLAGFQSAIPGEVVVFHTVKKYQFCRYVL